MNLEQMEKILWRLDGRLRAHEEVLGILLKNEGGSRMDGIVEVILHPGSVEGIPAIQAGWREAIANIKNAMHRARVDNSL